MHQPPSACVLLARALPEDWRISWRRERSASSRWEAGSHLMQTGDSRAWAAPNEAFDLLRDNREAIVKCREAAMQTGKPVRCSVEAKPSARRPSDDLPTREGVPFRTQL